MAASLWHLVPASALFADNGTFFVNNYHFGYKCTEEGGLHEWFNNTLVTWTPAAEAREPDAPCRRINSIYTMHTIHLGVPMSPDGYSSLAELGMPQVWRYQEWVQEEINEQLAKLEGLEPPTIGFHIRGGDKLTEDKQGNRTTTLVHHYIGAFAEEKRRLNKQPGAQPMGNGTCVFVGDDEEFIQEAAALAQRELGCKVFGDRAKYELPSHKQSTFNHLPLEDRCSATLHLLTDLELLAHTDYFVGSFTSGIAALVEKMRYVLYDKHRRTTIDASARKMDWYAQIRAYFEKEHPFFDYNFYASRVEHVYANERRQL
ncbi:hypothetical protein WJX81_005593 [Elliptochloris bilobata]|uniref:O-fucosyltransferase family protein n=1 Tax=Elliptochloris bilobata TaxID=381761 RepID=A0AAW1R2F0_9CHLO